MYPEEITEEVFECDSRAHKEIIEDVCECPEEHYCFLKDFIGYILHTDDRTLEQFKCIEKFKYEQSQREEKDIGWERAIKSWIDEGYAQKFREIYEECMKHSELYDKVMGR